MPQEFLETGAEYGPERRKNLNSDKKEFKKQTAQNNNSTPEGMHGGTFRGNGLGILASPDDNSPQTVTLGTGQTAQLTEEAAPGQAIKVHRKVRRAVNVSVDPKTGAITLSGHLKFFFKGDKDTQLETDSLNELNKLNGTFQDGNKTIVTNFTFSKVNKKRRSNIVVKVDRTSGNPDEARSRSRTIFLNNLSGNSSKAFLHETLHILGLNDAYDEYRIDGVTNYPDNRYTPPHPGSENSIMARSRLSPSFTDIQRLVNIHSRRR